MIRFPELPPAVTALLLQVTAVLLAALSMRVAPLPPLGFALLCGTYAAMLSHFAGQARWWLYIQFLFVPALVVMLAFDIPSELFLAAFLVLLVVYWSTFRTQVPLYLSSNKVWRALEDFLPQHGTGFRFVDLGSGLGGVLTHLSGVRPDGQYTGVESAPLPFLWSWLRIRFGGHRQCAVHWGSLWDCDLSQYDVVFAYLSPVPMKRLWHKARAEMRPGSVFISSTFAVPEQSPHDTVQVDDLHRSTLLVWRM
ncbi:MAG: class I SAM-dependent methyltransferase [Gallionella sp.]|nr:class I SAM-dependent methyltransferase [Gallionella sp.]MCK9354997.1 class I SAM-dependent methyltransferase [Gallionella sp.]